MRDCGPDIKSFLPGYARNTYGKLGQLKRPKLASRSQPDSDSRFKRAIGMAADAEECLSACQALDSNGLGPSVNDIAAGYKDRPDAENYLSGKIRSGGQGVWGALAMPAQAGSAAESAQLAW